MDNTSVLGQDPIEKSDLSKPILNNPGESLLEKRRSILSNVKDESTQDLNTPTQTVTLPQNISLRQSNKRLGEYYPSMGVNLQESMAQEQSGLEQMSYLIPRALTKAAVEAAKIPGYLGAFAEWGADGFNPSDFGDAFNNGWITSLDRFNTKLQDQGLPVYTPESVRDGNMWDKLHSTSFWATVGADGVGFLVGMMVPGLAFRYLKAGEAIEGLFAGSKGFTAAEKLAKPGSEIAEALMKSAKRAALINDYGSAIVNTGYEAASEGITAYNEYLSDHPDDIEGAGNAGAQTFKANLAILAGPNMLNQKWLFNGFNRAKNAIATAEKSTVLKALKKTITPEGITELAKPSIGAKVWKYAKHPLQGLVSEGLWEEGMQYTVAQMAKEGKDFNIENIINSYAEDISADTQGNAEMWSGIILGGVMGGVMGGIGGIRETRHEDRLTNEYHTLLKNNFANYANSLRDLAEMKDGKPVFNPDGTYKYDPIKVQQAGEQHVKGAAIRELALELLKSGDKEGYDLMTNSMHFNYMLPWLGIQGGLELLKKHIEALSKKEYNKTNEEEGPEAADAAISSIKSSLLSKAEKFQSIYDQVNDTHDINFKVKLSEGATKDDLNDFKNEIRRNKLSSKNALSYSLERIEALRSDLAKKGISVDDKLPSKELEGNLKKAYEEAKKNKPFDKVEDAIIQTEIENVKRHAVLYEDANNALIDNYDNKKLQKAFDQRTQEKLEAQRIEKESKDNASKKTDGIIIKDSGLRAFWKNNVFHETIASKHNIIPTEEGDVAKKETRITHGPHLKITYKDGDKVREITGVLGNPNEAGNVSFRAYTTTKEGGVVLSKKMGSLNSMTEYWDGYRKHTIDNYEVVKTAEESQKENHEKAAFDMYESQIKGYNQNIKDTKAALREVNKDIRETTKLIKEYEKALKNNSREEAQSILKISRQISRLKKKVRDLEKRKNETQKELDGFIEQKQIREDLYNDLKASGKFPLERLTELMDFAEEKEVYLRNMVNLYQESIDAANKAIKSYIQMISYYNKKLAKLLGEDNLDEKLGLKGKYEYEKRDIIANYLVDKVDELRADTTGDSYVFPTKAYDAAEQIRFAQEALRNIPTILKEAEEALAQFQEAETKQDVYYRAINSHYLKIFRAYKDLSTKYYGSTAIKEVKLIDGTAEDSFEGDFPVMFSIIKEEQNKFKLWENKFLRPWKGPESFLKITSNQNQAATNDDVARWYAFVNHYAYDFERFALKTVSFQQAAKDKVYKNHLQFWVGKKLEPNTGLMTPAQIEKASNREELEIVAQEDIKTVVVDNNSLDNVLLDKNGSLGTKASPGKFIVYSSVSLGEEIRSISAEDAFSFEQAIADKLKTMVKDPNDITPELRQAASDQVMDEFKKAQDEFVLLRKKFQKESTILQIDSVNPGVKEKVEEGRGLTDVKDALNFSTRPARAHQILIESNKRDEKTGEIITVTKTVSGREQVMVNGFPAIMINNRIEYIMPKTLSDTRDTENVLNLFKYAVSQKTDSEAIISYLKVILNMKNDNEDWRLFLVPKKNIKGEKISGEYSAIVYDGRSISVENLLAGKETADFKAFLGDKYWNFDKKSVNKAGSFTEYLCDNKLNLSIRTITDPHTKQKVGAWDKEGYNGFLLSGLHGSKSKGYMEIPPVPKGDAYKMELARNPQYANQSLNTSIRGEQKIAKDKSNAKEGRATGGEPVILEVEMKGQPTRWIHYDPANNVFTVFKDKELTDKAGKGSHQIGALVVKEFDKGNVIKGVLVDKEIKTPEIISVKTISKPKDETIDLGGKGIVEQTEVVTKEMTASDILNEYDDKASEGQINFIKEKNSKNIEGYDKLSDKEKLNVDAQEYIKQRNAAKESDEIEITFNREARNSDNYNKENIDKVTVWFKQKFPQFPLEVVHGLISNKSWGRLLNGSKVLISDIAEEGTMYHEAFHVWNNLFNTKENQKALYDEIRKATGENLSDKQAEEYLAEEFREFMMQGNDYVFPKGQELQKSLFQKILDAIKHIINQALKALGLNTTFDVASKNDIEGAFKAIRDGIFEIPIRETTETLDRVKEIKNPVKSLALLKDLNYRFFSVVTDDVLKGGDYILKLEDDPKEIYDGLKTLYEYKDQNRMAEGNMPIYDELLKYWDKFVDNHRDYLEQYNIHLPEVEEDDMVGRDINTHQESNKRPLRDSVPKTLKVLIGSLPMVKISETSGKAILSHSNFNTLSAVEFNKTMNIINGQLTTLTTMPYMMNKLSELSKVKPEIARLFNYLGGNNESMSNTQFILRTQFFNSFCSNKNLATLPIINNDGVFTYQNLTSEKDMEVTKDEWVANAQNLARNNKSKYIKEAKGSYIINKEALLNDINSRDKDLLLNDLGIVVNNNDKDFIKKNKEIHDYLQRLGQEIRIKIGQKEDVFLNDLYDRDKIENQGEMNNILSLAADFKLNDQDLMYFNQNGDPEWSISRNSHLSDIRNRLNDHSINRAIKTDAPIPLSLEAVMPYDDRTQKGSLYSTSSRWLRMANEGTLNMKVHVIKGVKNQSGEGNDLDRATYPDYKLATFDSILRNNVPLKRAAERGVEYSVEVEPSNWGISETQFIQEMFPYLYDELLTSFNDILIPFEGSEKLRNYEKNVKGLRTYSFIFDPIYNEGIKIETIDKYLSKEKTKTHTLTTVRQLVNDYIDENKEDLEVIFKSFINKTSDYTKLSLEESGLIEFASNNKYWIPGLNPETIEGERFMNLGRHVDGSNLLSLEGLNQVLLLHTYNDFISMQEQFKTTLGDLASYDSSKDFDKRTTSSASTKTALANDDLTLKLLDKFYPKITGQHEKTIKSLIVPTVTSNKKADKDLLAISDNYDPSNIAVMDGQMWGTMDFVRGTEARAGKWMDDMEMVYQYEMQNLVLKVLDDAQRGSLSKGYAKIWKGANVDMFIDGVFSKHTNGRFPDKPMFEGREIRIEDLGQVRGLKPLGVGFMPNTNRSLMVINKMSVQPILPSLLSEQKLKFLLSMMEHGYDKFGDEKSMKASAYLNNIDIAKGDLVTAEHIPTELLYEDYGLQQDIQQKDKYKTTDSTQKNATIYTDIFNNGILSKEYEDYPELADNMAERDQLMNRITQMRMDEVKEKLHVKYDEDEDMYKLTTPADVKEFKKLLTELFVQRLLPDNIIDGLDTVLDTKEKVFDIFTDANKVEQVLTAYIKNNVVSRKIRGEMFVQESSYLYDEDLNFYKLGDNSTTMAEVMIPIPKTWVRWVESIGGIDELNNRIAKGKIDNRLITFLANRIPTVSINTIEGFRVKKFLPYHAGARIVLPSEIVAKTSSDFDADKMSSYLANVDMTDDGPKYIEYQPGAENSEEAMINRVNELHLEALLHKARFTQLLTPHGSKNLKTIATDVYTPNSPIEKLEAQEEGKWSTAVQWWYNSKKAQDFWQGIQGVGYAASHNTVNAQLQINPIAIDNPIYKLFFSGQELKEGQKYSNGFVYDHDGHRTADNFGEFLVAYVDVAKDPFILKLNAVMSAFGLYSFLNKTGIDSGVGIRQIATMMSHPIIKEYLRRTEIRKSLFARYNQYTTDPRSDWYATHIGYDNDIISELINKANPKELRGLPNGSETRPTLASAIEDYINGDRDAEALINGKDIKATTSKGEPTTLHTPGLLEKYNYKYLTEEDMKKTNDPRIAVQILDNFLMYQAFARQSNKLNSVLRPYSSGTFPTTMNGIDNKMAKRASIVEKGFFNGTNILDHIQHGYFREVDNTYFNTLDVLKWTSLMRKHPDLYDLFKDNALRVIANVDRYIDDKDAEKILNKLKNNFISFLYAYTGEKPNVTAKMYREMFTGSNSIPNQLRDLKRSGKIRNEIFDILWPKVNDKLNYLGRELENDYITSHNRVNVSEENMLTAVYEDLLRSDDEQVKTFANDLFKFSILQSGLEYSPISYVKLLPNSKFMAEMDAKLSDIDFTSNVWNVAFKSFMDQFYRNNYQDPDVVMRSKRSINNINKLITLGADMSKSLEEIASTQEFNQYSKESKVPYISIRYNKNTKQERTENKKQRRRNAIEFLLYKNIGIQEINGKKKVVFKLVSKLGDGMRFHEYYPSAANGETIQSILDSNSYKNVITLPKQISLSEVDRRIKQKEVKESKKEERNDLKKLYHQLEDQGIDPRQSNEEIDNSMKNFLDRLGVTYKANDKLSSIAIAEITKMTLEVNEGKRNIITLPEEASHFYVALLDESSGLYRSMYNNIINYPIYQKTLDLYKDHPDYKNDEKKLREEAIGKLIADRIVNNYDNVTNDRQRQQVDTWWSTLWNKIKSLFTKISEDPYTKAAYDILTTNITQLTKAEVQSTVPLFKQKTPQERWNEIPTIAKGIYKTLHYRTLSEAMDDKQKYSDMFGDQNIRYSETPTETYKAKLTVIKPLTEDDISEKVIVKEDDSINNMKEFAKAPFEFKATDLITNFNEFFSDDAYLEDIEKENIMKAIELGEEEISCSF